MSEYANHGSALPIRGALSRPRMRAAPVADPVVCGQPEIRRRRPRPTPGTRPPPGRTPGATGKPAPTRGSPTVLSRSPRRPPGQSVRRCHRGPRRCREVRRVRAPRVESSSPRAVRGVPTVKQAIVRCLIPRQAIEPDTSSDSLGDYAPDYVSSDREAQGSIRCEVERRTRCLGSRLVTTPHTVQRIMARAGCQRCRI